MPRNAIPILIGALLLGGTLFPYGSGIAADDASTKEVMVRVVTKWDAPWYENCSGSQRDWWDDMAQAWYNAITNANAAPNGHGAAAWTAIEFKHNGSIVDSDFVDTEIWWGNDSNKIDKVDACMIALHGGNDLWNHRWYGRVRKDENGFGNCNAYQGDIELGDEDLEFLHLSSCYSMDEEDWWDEWNSTFDHLHQIDGFHGEMWIGASYPARYKDFADDAFWMSIADSWIDNLYVNDASGTDDECPVARNVGSNANDSLTRMNNERYNNVLTDPPGNGSARNHRVRYVVGCDPKGKGALQ